ncbi:MAG: bifunctional diaminohydroxyphosphoribosylaminopyrimidine deaminase/5-amino-6-(5-phosphoribosylamino)uracil reductase RibD [Eubacterium sp.]|nr:bifunctional diaminohydroxyphosphoribosylaminopyrimidine deaminase/5-amino-6-(5-phosphoribosylamino)uracil reductase RibD [Eubacterium sp.]
MRRALELAARGMGHTNPNPMVGAVIVRDGKIIGEGYHEKCGEGHAEVNAFAHCTEDPEGADMYVTLEPCSHYGKTPPCADLIVSKKIKNVYVGALDPNPKVSGRGIKKIRDAGIHVESGILAQESIDLNEVFMKYIVNKDPFVALKWAMTLDGKIATCTGESQWISSEESRAHSQTLRARYAAILAGVGTVIADNPRLTCRLEGENSPLRIILDTSFRVPEDSLVFTEQDVAKTIVAVGGVTDTEKKARLEEKGVEIFEAGTDASGVVDIKCLLAELGQRQIDSVLVEGGGGVEGSFVSQGLADRVYAYIAPVIVGGRDAKSPVEGDGIASLSDALRLSNTVLLNLGGDTVLTGRILR